MEAEAVKSALISETASSASIATLQFLLGLHTPSQRPLDRSVSRKAGPRKDATQRTAKGGRRCPTAPTSSALHEDAPKPLSTKERHGLATEVVNITIKVLTKAARPQQSQKSSRASQRVDSGKSSPASQRILQPRSANSTPSPRKVAASKGAIKNGTHASTDSHLSATAECSLLAFGYLLSVDSQTLRKKATPKWQLDNGLLALAGRLIALGLCNAAAKALGIVKRRLESLSAANDVVTALGHDFVSQSMKPASHPSVASLLRLDPVVLQDTDAMPLIISFQSLVLRLLAATRDPFEIETVARRLSEECATSPANVIHHFSVATGDRSKASKQLETVAQTIFALCASTSSSHDGAAVKGRNFLSAATIFQLQTLALEVRQKSCNLLAHRTDLEKELLGPFSKCLSIFARRSTESGSASDAYKLALAGYERLGIGSCVLGVRARFDILHTMASMCEVSVQSACGWAQEMVDCCVRLEPLHARRVASRAYVTALAVANADLTEDGSTLDAQLAGAAESLGGQVNGHTSDYDLLLAKLVFLMRTVRASASRVRGLPMTEEIIRLSAGFAQRYARSYPGRNSEHTQVIVLCALSLSKTSTSLDRWLSKDAVQILLDTGTLKELVTVASTRSMSVAWTSSSAAAALGRLLRALVLKSLRSQAEQQAAIFYDDESINAVERAALLEFQLQYSFELASRSKYHELLRRSLPESLRTLAEIYTVNEHPVRRARIATSVLRFYEMHPDILTPHAVKVWHNDFVLESSCLGEDAGLQVYLADVKAALIVAKAFHSGRPTADDLEPALAIWRKFVDGSHGARTLADQIDSIDVLRAQLESIAVYFAILGETKSRISALCLLLGIEQSLHNDDHQCAASIELARQYLDLGLSEKAGMILVRARRLAQQDKCSTLTKLQAHLGHAEYSLRIDNADDARASLEQARQLRTEIVIEEVCKENRRKFETLHAQAWLLQSMFACESGSPDAALYAAKHAVRLTNGFWSVLERSSGQHSQEETVATPEQDVPEINRLTAGVSKLQLTPQNNSKRNEPDVKGAKFWPLVHLSCRTLVQLSDMYAHHGFFGDADHYSRRAVEMAESVGAKDLLCRAQCHRARLMTLGENLEEAELCLTKAEEAKVAGHPVIAAERASTKAALQAKEGNVAESIQSYDSAISILNAASALSDDDPLQASILGTDKMATQTRNLDVTGAKRSQARQQSVVRAEINMRVPAKESMTRQRATSKTRTTKRSVLGHDASNELASPYLLRKAKAYALLEKALIQLRSSAQYTDTLELATHSITSLGVNTRHSQVQYLGFMQKAVLALQTDLSYSMLPESTLSFPAIAVAGRTISELGGDRAPLSSPAATDVPNGTSKLISRKTKAVESFVSSLQAAKDSLTSGRISTLQFSTTAEVYTYNARLSNVTMLLSAACLRDLNPAHHPTRQALSIEIPRIHASRCEHDVIAIEDSSTTQASPLTWPDYDFASPYPRMTAAAFQEQYIDIIPKTWTAVSLTLSEDHTELYATRYRSGQSPLLLRLPFSRNREDEDDRDVFDYDVGKAELQDIIQASNYSCHSGAGVDSRGAKSNWWSEREALDRRLHELLINIENIWLGGFKGVFSQHSRQSDLLARFRKSFDDILARYLPSRRTAKSRQKPLALDHKVLELFVGLGHDQDGLVDLDESLADLLYFVVDMLQFSGERNAYDEIDFDSMAVDVLDVLRSYHEASVEEGPNRHLILILDKRLQAFPWESIPCLEGASVSRVGSMLSLRERIVAMRTQEKDGAEVRLAEVGHIVARDCGSYILNPAGDLSGTEATLVPALQRLSQREGASWKPMVRQALTEDEFSGALTQSSILLYFGHGSGAQYIRPRKIKRLEKCSEVVWLIGCSSGAVTEYGELEPFAVPLAYLMAGKKDRQAGQRDEDVQGADAMSGKCMAVVATLWDVTDKDIDRFSLAVGEDWGLFASSEASKLPKKAPHKRAQIADTSTPQQVPKTPKTPKTRKTPAVAKTPARSRSRPRREDEGRKKSLVEAVARSRDACYLRYLNGAAPVVYGIPVYLGD